MFLRVYVVQVNAARQPYERPACGVGGEHGLELQARERKGRITKWPAGKHAEQVHRQRAGVIDRRRRGLGRFDHHDLGLPQRTGQPLALAQQIVGSIGQVERGPARHARRLHTVAALDYRAFLLARAHVIQQGPDGVAHLPQTLNPGVRSIETGRPAKQHISIVEKGLWTGGAQLGGPAIAAVFALDDQALHAAHAAHRHAEGGVALLAKLLHLQPAVGGIAVSQRQNAEKHRAFRDGAADRQVEVFPGAQAGIPPYVDIAVLALEFSLESLHKLRDPAPRLVIAMGVTDEKVILEARNKPHAMTPCNVIQITIGCGVRLKGVGQPGKW